MQTRCFSRSQKRPTLEPCKASAPVVSPRESGRRLAASCACAAHTFTRIRPPSRCVRLALRCWPCISMGAVRLPGTHGLELVAAGQGKEQCICCCNCPSATLAAATAAQHSPAPIHAVACRCTLRPLMLCHPEGGVVQQLLVVVQARPPCPAAPAAMLPLPLSRRPRPPPPPNPPLALPLAFSYCCRRTPIPPPPAGVAAAALPAVVL